MRICHIIEAGGGAAQVVLDLAAFGVAAGDDITVVYAPGRQSARFKETLTKLLGPKFIAASMRREVGPHDLFDAWQLYKTLKGLEPFDILHAHSSKAGALLRLMSFFLQKSLIIYSPHAFVSLNPDSSAIFRIVERVLGKLGGPIFVLSKVEKDHALEALAIRENQLRIIHNGIEVAYPAARAPAREKLGAADTDFLLGTVIRFVPQKNPLRLLDAFHIASRHDARLRLALVGDGPLRPEIEAAIATKGLKALVTLHAGLNGRDVIPAFDGLMCSSDYEGFALIFLEALAAGVPIVTTPVGGAHETVLEGKTGFMAKDFTSESLADALERLTASDAATRLAMADAARAHAENFALERIGREMQSLYVTLLAKRRK